MTWPWAVEEKQQDEEQVEQEHGDHNDKDWHNDIDDEISPFTPNSSVTSPTPKTPSQLAIQAEKEEIDMIRPYEISKEEFTDPDAVSECSECTFFPSENDDDHDHDDA